jgi:DNA-binding transcriptional ArsR family regulator
MVVDQGVAGRLSADEVDRIFHALADATRRDIVRRVLVSEQSIGELARRYPMSVAAVQKHIAVLTSAGLVSKTPRGREQRVAGRPETVRKAQALLDELEQQWRGRIDRMGSVLADLTQEEQT